jgi:hypothetical protein
MASLGAQELELGLGFHALRDDIQVEVTGQCDDARNDTSEQCHRGVNLHCFIGSGCHSLSENVILTYHSLNLRGILRPRKRKENSGIFQHGDRRT